MYPFIGGEALNNVDYGTAPYVGGIRDLENVDRLIKEVLHEVTATNQASLFLPLPIQDKIVATVSEVLRWDDKETQAAACEVDLGVSSKPGMLNPASYAGQLCVLLSGNRLAASGLFEIKWPNHGEFTHPYRMIKPLLAARLLSLGLQNDYELAVDNKTITAGFKITSRVTRHLLGLENGD